MATFAAAPAATSVQVRVAPTRISNGRTRKLHYRVGDGVAPTRDTVTDKAALPIGAVVERVTYS